jgi:AraC-like DNA-binding protein
MANHRNRAGEVTDYINANWRSGIPLKRMAADFGMDPADMERVFRSATGVTVKRYIDEQKKRHLVRLLKDGNQLGYQIGGELSFRNDEAFYRWVKRVFGVPFKALRGKYPQSAPRFSAKKGHVFPLA